MVLCLQLFDKKLQQTVTMSLLHMQQKILHACLRMPLPWFPSLNVKGVLLKNMKAAWRVDQKNDKNLRYR